MKKVYSKLNETIYQYTFKNGLQARLIPNNKFAGVSAGISFNCGSVSSGFKLALNNSEYNILSGMAHFLEHRIFDYKKGPVFDLYSALGANCNAYTSFENTVYYFKGNNNIEECLNLLLGFTSDFQISEQSVENEKKIIIEEIKMYRDFPDHVSQMKILEQLYFYHPIKLDIGGDEKSVSATTLKDLQNFQQYFYHPSNAIVYVTGNFELDKVVNLLRQFKFKKTCQGELVNPIPKEPNEVAKKENKIKMDVSIPSASLAFKLKPEESNDKIKKIMTISILLDMLFSSNNELYETMLNQAIINSTFFYNLNYGKNYLNLFFYTETNKHQEFFKLIIDAFTNLNVHISKKLFTAVKNNLIGSFLKALDNPHILINNLFNSSWSGIEYLDEFKILNSITYEEVLNSISIDDLQHYATLLIEPK